MGRSGYSAEGIDHGGENHIAEGSGEALGQIRKGNPEAGTQDHRIRPEGLADR